MAKIEIFQEDQPDFPPSVESIEVIVWGTGGTASQELVIGSGSNFNASTNVWIEIRYAVQGLPVFYTRNIISHAWGDLCEGQAERLEKFVQGETEGFGFGDMLPETGIWLKREVFNHTNHNGENESFTNYSLTLSLDMGAVFGHSGPGSRMLDIRFPYIDQDEGLRFMNELVDELQAACQGRHPDPGQLPDGFSQWPFARELNRRAYNQLAESYTETYFDEPLLQDSFNRWLDLLPQAGRVLDAGCGHGDPVIAHLLKSGFHATGSDLSPAMLARARQQFPQVEFVEQDTAELTFDAEFDGVCSFSSMIYLDQIDFFHSIYRVYRALKPDGLLFLYGYDLHPRWRGQPYHVDLERWLWGGTRGIEETTHALEEHGYFKVLQSARVESEEAREQKIIEWREQTQKEHDEWLASLDPQINIKRTDYSTITPRLAYPYVIIAKKQKRGA